jgi:hypothetical protein
VANFEQIHLAETSSGAYRVEKETAMSKFRPHVGRELDMMLAGEKPMAMFYGDADSEPDERIIPEQRFDKYVEAGAFVKKAFVFECAVDPRTKTPVRVKYVLYASAAEQWRTEAMHLALETMMAMGRADEGLDRIMASLLGHSLEDIEDLVAGMRKQYALFAQQDYGGTG